MADPIVSPSVSVVIPAIQAVVAAQPQARPFIEGGGYWSAVPKIIEAHTDVALARVVDEVQSARLRFAKGASLRELSASEFNLSLQPAPQASIATIVLARGAGLSDGSQVGSSPAGVIKAGQTFTKPANPNAFPIPVGGATYQAIQTTYVPAGAQIVMVPCIATTPGPDANVPTFTNTTSPIATVTGGFLTTIGVPTSGVRILMAVDTPDPFHGRQGLQEARRARSTLWVASLSGAHRRAAMRVPSSARPQFALNASPGTPVAVGTTITLGNTQDPADDATLRHEPQGCVDWRLLAGGSAGIDDPGLVAAARLNAVGQYGPTDAALVAGVLQQQSVAHYAFFEATAQTPYAQGYVADPSWSSSGLGLGTGTSWMDSVAAKVAQGFQGFKVPRALGTGGQRARGGERHGLPQDHGGPRLDGSDRREHPSGDPELLR